VRIRILQASEGVIRGISLGHFLPGLTYDVEESIGAHLIASGAAVQVEDGGAELLVGSEDDDTSPMLFGGVSVSQPPLDEVADRPRWKRH
jgi:hypothetical protein